MKKQITVVYKPVAVTERASHRPLIIKVLSDYPEIILHDLLWQLLP